MLEVTNIFYFFPAFFVL